MSVDRECCASGSVRDHSAGLYTEALAHYAKEADERSRAATAQERVTAALALHERIPGRVAGTDWCGLDGEAWPCPTVCALTEDPT